VGKDAQQMSSPNIVDFTGKGLDQMNWEDIKILENNTGKYYRRTYYEPY
jgi:hypothetical protein